MITAVRGRQRECVLLDGSQVQQHSNNSLGITKIHTKSTLQRNGPNILDCTIDLPAAALAEEPVLEELHLLRAQDIIV